MDHALSATLTVVLEPLLVPQALVRLVISWESSVLPVLLELTKQQVMKPHARLAKKVSMKLPQDRLYVAEHAMPILLSVAAQFLVHAMLVTITVPSAHVSHAQ